MKKENESSHLTNTIVKGMLEKKAWEIVTLELHQLENSFCNYFVICHGDSNTHVESIVESIESEVNRKLGEKPWSKEGYENAEWILLDYGDVIANVFQKEQRDFYRMEELWADAQINTIEELVPQAHVD